MRDKLQWLKHGGERAYSPITPFVEFAPAEVFDSPLRRELQEAGFPVKNGAIEFPDTPGIGYRFPEHLVAKYRIR